MQLKSIKYLFFWYIGIGIVGGFLLWLPMSVNGKISFVDALFTSVSALCCAGLVVKDTLIDFSITGQAIIMFLMQLGGLGYMSLIGFIYLMFRKRMSNSEKNMLKEMIYYQDLSNISFFIKKTFLYVFVIESIGAILLSIDFGYRFGLSEGIWDGVFHSISAFNNAGFSTFSKNLVDFQDDLLVNIVISLLAFAGGLGYICLLELDLFIMYKLGRKKSFNNNPFSHIASRAITPKGFRFSLHFKIVLYTSAILIIVGAIVILLLENGNKATFGSFSLLESISSSLFTSINLRSSGLSIFDMSGLNDSTLFFTSILMLIGGAPGGTTTGIKVTSLAVLFAFFRGVMRGEEPRLFNRSLRHEDVQKALMVALLSNIYFFVITLILILIEPSFRFVDLAFEVSSAFANVGYSKGNGDVLSLSANFSNIGKMIITITILLGKIGIILSVLALFGQFNTNRVSYIKEKIIL